MKLLAHLANKKLILASKSPRRQQLLSGLELSFEIRTKDVDESFPSDLKEEEIALYLAKIKADSFREEIQYDEIFITADTIVWVNDHVLNKPETLEEAAAMVRELSGNCHTVYTGVAITSSLSQRVFFDATKVFFVELSQEEIEHYVQQYQPFDKAGAYGVQELIGYIGIEKLEGSYYNVMGLPVQRLYQELKLFKG